MMFLLTRDSHDCENLSTFVLSETNKTCKKLKPGCVSLACKRRWDVRQVQMMPTLATVMQENAMLKFAKITLVPSKQRSESALDTHHSQMNCICCKANLSIDLGQCQFEKDQCSVSHVFFCLSIIMKKIDIFLLFLNFCLWTEMLNWCVCPCLHVHADVSCRSFSVCLFD